MPRACPLVLHVNHLGEVANVKLHGTSPWHFQNELSGNPPSLTVSMYDRRRRTIRRPKETSLNLTRHPLSVLLVITALFNPNNTRNYTFASPRAELVGVTNLETNATSQPLGLDDPAPRFTWRLASERRAV